MPPKALILYCYGAFELNLFLRLRAGLASRHWKLVIVSHLPSIVWRARRLGLDAVRLRAVGRERFKPNVELMHTPEGILGDLKPADADRFSRSVWDGLERTCQTFPVGAIAILNGVRLAGPIAKAFALDRGIPTLFFELGNIDQKLFADPQGVNAASRLAHNPERLDHFAMSDEEIAAWREAYARRRMTVGTVPQARRSVGMNPWLLVDRVAAPLMGIPQGLNLSLIRRGLFKLRMWRQREGNAIKPSEPYIFLPLQVSFDSNLLIHSDHDNLSAIEFAAARAQQLGLSLVVKPHPAELDANASARVAKACDAVGCLLTSYNTAELVMGAEEVITINSTVGLDARLMGKPVTLLGRSVYQRFTDRQAVIYCARYLIDLSPFGREPATEEAVNRLLACIDENAEAG